MSDVLRPGPYKTDNGNIVVVLDGAPDEDGDIAAYHGISHFQGSHYSAKSLTASDVWPDWWPFQNATIPERELQVGDFIRYEGKHITERYEVIGLRFGRVQMIDRGGYPICKTDPLDDERYRRVERPDDWPTE